MKHLFVFAILILGSLFLMPAQSTAQDLPYTEGSVWDVSFIRIKPGMDTDYLKSLAAGWKKVFDEAKKDGLVLSYKILSGSAANKDDWDMMLMVEYKNMATLDGLETKFDAINKKVVGSESQQKEVMTKRVEMREIIGGKLLRELLLK
jgi:hypothetical protein